MQRLSKRNITCARCTANAKGVDIEIFTPRKLGDHLILLCGKIVLKLTLYLPHADQIAV